MPRLALSELSRIPFGLAMVVYPATFVPQIVETEFGFRMDGLEAAHFVDPLDRNIHVAERLQGDAIVGRILSGGGRAGGMVL